MLSKPQPEVLNCQNTVKEREREMEEESPYSCEHAEEDYIDMEVCSHSTIFSHSKSSQPDPREFEFQMFSTSVEKDTTTSPADELFYKGKLLPLHLPPRLEMVEKLLQNPSTYNIKAEINAQFDAFEESFRTPSCTPTNHTPTTNTPFESCNVSPAESCQVSRELNPEEYFFGHVANDNPKRTGTRKLRLMKQSSLSSKLKASRAYLKSLFVKSSCSSQSSAAASRMINKGLAPQANEGCKTHAKVAKKEPLGQIQRGGCQTSSSLAKSFNKENPSGDEGGHHRRSFSAAFKRISTTTKISSSVTSSSGCSSASSSNNSNGFQELQFFKRSASAYSDIENSIQAAIAHCKRSQQKLHSTNTVTDLGICSMSASKVTCEEQERPALCQS